MFASSSNSSSATSRVASASAWSGQPIARRAVAASRNTAVETLAAWRRSARSQDSKAAPAWTSIPSRRSRPSAGTWTASTQVADPRASTSTNASAGSARTTGSPPISIDGRSDRRNSARFQRSAPSGSSASPNSSSARRSRGTGAWVTIKYARRAHAFQPRGPAARSRSTSIQGAPSRWMPIVPTRRAPSSVGARDGNVATRRAEILA